MCDAYDVKKKNKKIKQKKPKKTPHTTFRFN